MKDMEVKSSTRQEDGSCNSCQRRDVDHVFVLSVRTMTLRLCAECASSLHGKLWDALMEREMAQHGYGKVSP